MMKRKEMVIQDYTHFGSFCRTDDTKVVCDTADEFVKNLTHRLIKKVKQGRLKVSKFRITPIVRNIPMHHFP